jgi:hypothetical protein
LGPKETEREGETKIKKERKKRERKLFKDRPVSLVSGK